MAAPLSDETCVLTKGLGSRAGGDEEMDLNGSLGQQLTGRLLGDEIPRCLGELSGYGCH